MYDSLKHKKQILSRFENRTSLSIWFVDLIKNLEDSKDIANFAMQTVSQKPRSGVKWGGTAKT